jgi:phosphate-selective porin
MAASSLVLPPSIGWADKFEDLERAIQMQQKAIEAQQQQMRQLQQELDRLRQERAAQQAEMSRRVIEAEKKAEEVKAASLNAGYKDGFYLKSADDRFRLNLTGYLQSWFILEPGDRQQQNTFRIRRSRLITEGHLFNDFGYNFEWEFAPTARIEQAFATYRRFPEATLIVGQHKPRYSLESLTSSRDLDFAERAIIVRALAPDQQLGITLEGRLFDNLVSYGAGVYNGCGRIDQCPGALDNDNDKEITARVGVTPVPELRLAADVDFRSFRRTSKGTATDGGGATVNNIFNPTTHTGFKLAGAGFPIEGNRVATSGDVVLTLYPFEAKGEYHYAWQERHRLGSGGTDLPDLRIQGGYGQLGYWLFGKKPAGLLALARYEYVRIDADLLKNNERPATVHAGLLGLNWYLNRHVRLRLNYIATDIDPKTNTNRRGGGGGIAHEAIAEVQIGF